MPKLPLHLQAKPQSDTRQHPQHGLTYRVRDKDWAEVWGVALSHRDAEQLVRELTTSLKSRTARVEAEDVGIPDKLFKQAQKAAGRAIVAGRIPSSGVFVDMVGGSREQRSGEGDMRQCEHCGSWVPVPIESQASTSLPVPPWADPASATSDMAAAAQLKNIQGAMFVVAGTSAADAQKRYDEKVAADARRAQYKKEREDAEKENKRLEAEALKLEQSLGDAADVPEGDIDDLLGGTGAMPTDEEIRKAKQKAAEDAAKQRSLR